MITNNLWIDFSRYETSQSSFSAELNDKGGYIIFSNSGKRGTTKYFTLGLESFRMSLLDIRNNINAFSSNTNYHEKTWRDLGGEYFSDPSAKAQITVQTKPFFATLSKIIMWANKLRLSDIDPEQSISFSPVHLDQAIESLGKLIELFTPNEVLPESSPLREINDNFDLLSLIEDVQSSELYYSKSLVARFTASLLTKPFLILTGLSGSGKTKLAQAFTQWICEDESQYCIVPVGADWTNREPLLGYPNALEAGKYVKPDNGVLDLIIEANQKPDVPFFLILDEMNLSHVERYFADFLSVMESKGEIPLFAEGTADNGVPSKLKLPSNLFIIGTVNIDETTNMFSPKVLDRANTIEFRVTQKEIKKFLSNIREINMSALTRKGASMARSFLEMAKRREFGGQNMEDINGVLVNFFGQLKKTGAEFGYRSATEILRLINQLSVLDDSLSENEKLDIAIMQKLLPKLHGSRRKLCPVLETLGHFCLNEEMKNIEKEVFRNDDFKFEDPQKVKYPLSLEKIARMYRGAVDNGFASFAEA